MKYFFVSDLHGCDPTLLQDTLQRQGFDPRDDTLVVVGDVVDRGLYTMPLVKYLIALPHLIPIWGNHDWRLREILLDLGDHHNVYDVQNGVPSSLHSIADYPSSTLFDIWHYLNVAIPGNRAAADNIRVLQQYWSRCVWALEFNDLYVTHGWLPHHSYLRDGLIKHELVADLTDLPRSEWVDATWANSHNCLVWKLYPSKPLLVGHWWAAEIRSSFQQHKTMDDAIKDGTVDFSTFVYNNVTFIDSCTPYSYTINVVVKEYDEDPFVYASGAPARVARKRMSEV